MDFSLIDSFSQVFFLQAFGKLIHYHWARQSSDKELIHSPFLHHHLNFVSQERNLISFEQIILNYLKNKSKTEPQKTLIGAKTMIETYSARKSDTFLYTNCSK